MIEERSNLVQEILTIMERLNFKKENIDRFLEDRSIAPAVGYVPNMQRAVIITYFHNLLVSTEEEPPVEIRLTLNGSQSNSDWVGEMAAYVLPFIKSYEDLYHAE